MIFIKKYSKIIFNKLLVTKYSLYLYYIRYKIYRASDPRDLINILKQIASHNHLITTDELSNVLTDCLIQSPLTEYELQKMSTWEQLYNRELGIYNYVTTLFWLCTIKAIQENEYKLLK